MEDFILTEEDLELAPFDVCELLVSEEDFRLHMQIYYEEEGIQGLKKAVDDVARAKFLNELADKTGLSREYLIKNLYHAENNSQTEIIQKILKALNIDKLIKDNQLSFKQLGANF